MKKKLYRVTVVKKIDGIHQKCHASRIYFIFHQILLMELDFSYDYEKRLEDKYDFEKSIYEAWKTR